MTAKALGFDGPCMNSLDAVSDRDFVVETLSALSILSMHLSRFSEDIILWASSEWKLITLDDAWSTGSSIMPQKRNPDLLELTRGKTGRVYGSLIGLLTTLNGLPLTYNRDLQEDKEPLFDAVKTVSTVLECLASFISTITIDPDRAKEMLKDGFLETTVMAEYLVEKGLPFRTAHEVCGTLVRTAERDHITLAELPLSEMQKASPLFSEDIYSRLDPEQTPELYKSLGAAGHKAAEEAIMWFYENTDESK